MNIGSELKQVSYEWIARLVPRQRFGPSDIYRFLDSNCRTEIKAPGHADKEPRYQNDARWAIKNAHLNSLITHIGRGVWERSGRPGKPEPIALNPEDLKL